jgi:predicted ABC-type ATPase
MWKLLLLVLIIALVLALKTGGSWIDVDYKCYISNEDYDKLYKKYSKELKKKKEKVPVAILIGGVPASGKSTLAKKLKKKYKNYVFLEEDDVMKDIKSFQDGLNLVDISGKHTGVGTTRAFVECSGIYNNLANDIYGKATDKGLSHIESSPRTYTLIPLLKKKGYKVIYYDIWNDEAPKRREERALRTGKFIGNNWVQLESIYEFGGLWADEVILIHNDEEKKFSRDEYIRYMDKYFK